MRSSTSLADVIACIAASSSRLQSTISTQRDRGVWSVGISELLIEHPLNHNPESREAFPAAPNSQGRMPELSIPTTTFDLLRPSLAPLCRYPSLRPPRTHLNGGSDSSLSPLQMIFELGRHFKVRAAPSALHGPQHPRCESFQASA